jgi:hypothetical protein
LRPPVDAPTVAPHPSRRHGDGALVIYERDGAPLADDEGKIALVSLKDTRPGPRHVKWLQSIELRALGD